MRIHHLNCGCMCPLGGALLDGSSRGIRAQVACHCLLVESESGLVLVDTGFGLQDVRRPRRLSLAMRIINGVVLDEALTARRQIERLGFEARDVRHIVLTHLDYDHAGGLDDFPDAVVHVMRAEKDAARTRRDTMERSRYRPAQWESVKHWREYEAGEDWFGFGAVRDLDGLPPEILMIPLPGHTHGHAGVAIRSGEGWVLHAGDSYFHHGDIRPEEGAPPAALRALQRMLAVDPEALRLNQERLRALAADPEAGVRILCSHDRHEFDAWANGASRRVAA